jgi:hypothetical protein
VRQLRSVSWEGADHRVGYGAVTSAAPRTSGELVRGVIRRNIVGLAWLAILIGCLAVWALFVLAAYLIVS